MARSRTAKAAEPPKTEFIGTPGVPDFGGWIYDEREPRLQGSRKLLTFREMAENHPLIAVGLQMAATACVSVAWHVRPASPDDPTALRAGDLVTRAIEGIPWSTLIEEQSDALRDGFALHEVAYRRVGREWLWSRIEVRRASTIQQWMATEPDGGGDWLGCWQQTPTRRVFIPSERLIHVIARRNGGNPEGYSLLRPLFKPYRLQANLMRLQGIGAERNLAGLPVVNVPVEVYNDATKRALYERFVRSIRVDEQMGAVFPPKMDSTGQPTGFDFSLLSVSGRGEPTLPAIQFYESQIAIGLLVQFLLLGAGGAGGSTGSYSLASSHTTQHAAFLGAFLDRIAEANQAEINRLQDLNGIPEAARATVVHGDIEKIDLGELGTYLDALSRSGVPLADPAAVAHLREIGGLPPADATGEAL